jgi:O-antigen/teichoic acid export membrane protein
VTAEDAASPPLARRLWPGLGATSFNGALPVGVGLAVQAVTAYLTLIAAGRLVGAAEFGGLAALYVLLSTVPPGLFLPLEQEIARRRGRERTTGRRDPTLVRRAVVLGGSLSAVVLTVVAVLWTAAAGVLDGQPQLLAAFCLGLPGYALCHISRGVLAGAHRLRRYGAQLAVDSTFRLVGLLLLAALGVRSATAYGWLFGIAPFVGLAGSMIGFREPARETSPAQPLAGPLAWLLTGSIATQLLIGAGPLTVQLFTDKADAARAGAFIAALVLVRLPLVLFSAVQPSMLPAMSADVAGGRQTAFTRRFTRVLAVMIALALLTTAGFSAAGPWGLALLFGSDFVLSWSVFLLMGLAVSLVLVAIVLGQVILALGAHRYVATGWLAGLGGLGVGLVLAHDALLRANLGLLVGGGAVALTFALLLPRALRRPQPGQGSPVGAEAVA